MSDKIDKRITEQSSLYEHLEKMSVDELTAHINAENKKVALAIEQALPAINQLISAIEGQLKKGGRLFYAGCGTGGRLATLDTIEVQNTYGIDGSQIQAIFLEASAALRKPGNPEKTTWRMVGTSSAINISQSRISYSVFLPAAQPHSCFPSCSIARRQVFLRVASSTILMLPSPKQPIIP